MLDFNLLELSWNKLIDGLPAELAKCTHLSHLDMNNNHFSGPISGWFGDFCGLGELKISFNEFNGTITSWFWNCTSLLTLALDNNKLWGSLSRQLGNLVSLNVLYL